MVVLPVPGSPPKIINILIPLILQIILILPMFDQYGPVLRYVRSAATMFKLENLLSDFHIHPDIHLRITLGIITGIIDWASARASFAEEDFSPLELDEWSNESKLK